MPPFASYASALDGSLRVISSNLPGKYGNGALLVENGCEFFGSSDQTLRSSASTANFLITSGQNIAMGATGSFSVTGTSSSITARTGHAELLATKQDVRMVSDEAEAYLRGQTRAYIHGQTNVLIKSVNGKTELQSGTTTDITSGTTLSLNAQTINVGATGSFSVTGTSSTVTARTGDLTLVADAQDAKVVSTLAEALLSGKTSARVQADTNVKIKSVTGKIDIESGSTADLISVGAFTVKAPTVQTQDVSTLSLNAATTSTLDAVTVNVGGTLSNDVNISRASKKTTVKGELKVDQAAEFGDNVTIAGNLTVSGTTTTINTENILIEDNLMVLNSANVVNKDAGFLFKKGSTGASSLFWDESDATFVLGLTDSAHDSALVTVSELAPIKCSTISTASFATTTFSLVANSGTPVSVAAINKTRGVYEFQIESDAPNGSVYNYKVVKNAIDTPPVSFGIHAAGLDGSQVWVSWGDNAAPQFYLKSFDLAAVGNLTFKVKYLTV
jgi:hypothetical protein